MRYHVPILLTSVILIVANVNGYNLSDYRLPTYAVPSFNYFYVDLRNPEANTFNAKAWMQVTLPVPVTELVLNVDPNYINMESIGVDTVAASFVCIPGNYSAKTQLMALYCFEDLDEDLDDGKIRDRTTTTFRFDYTAKFSDGPSGLSKSKFKVNNSESYVIFTQFEPTSLRRVFPSFDEPNIKAPIRVGVDHNADLIVVSNMDYADNYDFLDTPNMSTYLMAIVAGPTETFTFYHSSDERAQFDFSIFAQRIYADYVSYALENGPNLIRLMGNYTDLPYETLGNSKMTFAALPGMRGGLENWGLIMFSETSLINEAERTSHKAIINSLTLMAHEIAHQWIGNYVTFNWWSEVWLNEGFANYFEWYLPSLVEEEYEYEKMFLIREFQPALEADGPHMVPLSIEESKVNTREEIEDGFTTNGIISYFKGASVIRMINQALGKEVFQKAIQTYLKANALGNVKASNLIDHLQAALPNTTDVNLTMYLNSWIYEPGYPILKTSIAETDVGSLKVTIDIYTFDPSPNNNDSRSMWWVPVTYATSDRPFWDNATSFWINGGKSFGYYIQDTSDSWAVLNVHASGYYRVDYDTKSLARIFRVLNSPETYTQIPVLNRAQLIDDLFNIAKYYTESNDNSPYENAITFVQYLKHEEEYYPWHTFLKEVQYLLYLLDDEATITLTANVLELIEAQLVIPNDTYIYQVSPPEALKSNLLLDWACRFGHEVAIKYVKEKFDMYKTDPKSINNNYRDVIICNGFQFSDHPNADYNTLMNLMAKSSSPQEQQDIGMGLVCSFDTVTLDKYLATTLEDDPPIAKQFWPEIFSALLYQRGPVGLQAALRFLSKNANAIMQKWKKPMDFKAMITYVSNRISKTELIALLSNLLNTFSVDSDVGHTVVKALAEAEASVKLLETFGDGCLRSRTWLFENYYKEWVSAPTSVCKSCSRFSKGDLRVVCGLLQGLQGHICVYELN